MSKLTAKIETLAARMYARHMDTTGGQLDAILADVRELEREIARQREFYQSQLDAVGTELSVVKKELHFACAEFDKANTCAWDLASKIEADIRAAKREAYEHARSLCYPNSFNVCRTPSEIEARLTDAIDALDTEGNSDE